jgi:hypothetical protein
MGVGEADWGAVTVTEGSDGMGEIEGVGELAVGSTVPVGTWLIPSISGASVRVAVGTIEAGVQATARDNTIRDVDNRPLSITARLYLTLSTIMDTLDLWLRQALMVR